MIQNQDYIQEFIEEAKAHIEKVEATLLKKEDIRNDKESINEIFRAVHSIKGTAGFFGLKKIVALAHVMENVFGEIRNGKVKLSSSIVDIMLSANDCMKGMVDDVLNSESVEVEELVEKLSKVLIIGDEEVKESVIILKDAKGNIFKLEGSSSSIIMDGIKYGHKIFEVKLRINKDLLSYKDGPVKLFKKIQSVGMLVDTVTDHSEINSFEDILEALSDRGKDVYLGIIVTSVLQKELYAEAMELSEENINELILYNGQVEQNEIKEDKKIEEPKPNIEIQSHIKVEDSIRVHVSVLNDLLNMASEMVLGRNQLLRTLEGYRKTIPGLSPILQNIDRLTSLMQEKIMQTRMQPIANVFSKFPRIIRDLSKNLGKEMELQLEGEEVELDKSVIEALTDPLTHLVRNSADHGLESSEERVINGKKKIGLIKLKAFHEGGYVNIDVSDDGRGINTEKLCKKAIENGIITRDDLSGMSEQEMLKLIFKPGFSTAEVVSDISGRGVGMDVVKTNIEKLDGAIEIFTAKNSGTTIRLKLPLTLAIIQSLIVEVEGMKFALPQINLKEIVRIKQGDNSRSIEFIHNSEVLRLRGKLLPIIHLADILGIQRTFIDPVTGEKKNEKRKNFGAMKKDNLGEKEFISKRDKGNSVIRILVLQMANRDFGVAVDSIFASEETLVKPLPSYLKNCKCYSGVTIMGDGKTAMILDIEGLISMSDLKFNEDKEKPELNEDLDREKMLEKQNLLFFKCTGNETYAIDLSMISRVEEITNENIEFIGDRQYIKFRGDSLRVIYPETYLPVNSSVSGNNTKYVLIPKLVSHPIGIIVEKIIDNVNTNLKLNTEDSKVEGLLGTAIYENKIILLINLYELFEKADPEHYSKDIIRINKTATLLLVEDTPFFQRQEKEYLESAGFNILTANNGKEALNILQAEEVNCLVSDIQMPVMDGLELIKKIREHPKYSKLPAVAVTSMSGDEQRRIGLQSGFDFYEFKLDRDKLIETVKKALEKI